MEYIKLHPESRRRLNCPLIDPNGDLGGYTLKVAQKLEDYATIEKDITRVSTLRYAQIRRTNLPATNTTTLPNPGVMGDMNI